MSALYFSIVKWFRCTQTSIKLMSANNFNLNPNFTHRDFDNIVAVKMLLQFRCIPGCSAIESITK